MSRVLKISLREPDGSYIHFFRNFGEDVFREFRDECEVSLEEIDASTHEFHIRGVRKRDLRAVAAKVKKIAAKGYGMMPPVEVREVQDKTTPNFLIP